MRALVYDCSAGISGDMNLAALIDLGVDRESLELSKLHVHGDWKLECRRAQQSGIQGTRIDVLTVEEGHSGHGHAHHHRTMADIRRLIGASGLSDAVKRTALSIFSLLAEAEAQVHGTTPEEVHFHEVGAVDSIIDITGAAICLELLRADAVFTGPVELGSGTVTCQHGTMPVPAPATALLASRFQSTLNGTTHEATTPTGAAYIAALARPVPAPLAGRITGGEFPGIADGAVRQYRRHDAGTDRLPGGKADGGRRAGRLAGVHLHEEGAPGGQSLRPVPAGTGGPREGSVFPAQQHAGDTPA